MIDRYTFGKFIIDKTEYKSNVLLLGKTAKLGRYLPEHELSINDIILAVDYKPEYIVIGTGADGVMSVTAEISEFIESKGINLIVLKTKDACMTYNALLKEGKKVAAFLHNTC